MTHILIGTPSYGDHLATNYVSSILRLKELFEQRQPRVGVDFFFFSHAMVTYARNVFASRMLENPQYTHLLMIDSDMGFPTDLITNMLAFDKPIVATVYPKRTVDPQNIITHARAMTEDTPEQRKRALAMSYEFVGESELLLIGEGAEKRLDVQNGFVRARAAGTGIMLIKRHVFEDMLARFPELIGSHVPGGATTLTKMYFQPFNEYTFNGVVLSEDLSFCHRWTTEMGGELWAQIGLEISHLGHALHSASYIDKLLSIATRSNLS